MVISRRSLDLFSVDGAAHTMIRCSLTVRENRFFHFPLIWLAGKP